MVELHGLDELMMVDDAVRRWPKLFGREELNQAARNGRLRHIRKGRKRLVTEAWLKEWLADKEIEPCRDEKGRRRAGSASPDTGSTDTNEARSGTATGMTAEQEEYVADLLVQKYSKKPRKSSPASS